MNTLPVPADDFTAFPTSGQMAPKAARAWYGAGWRHGRIRGASVAALVALLSACGDVEVVPAPFQEFPPLSTHTTYTDPDTAAPIDGTDAAETLYAHSPLNVRMEPSSTSKILRTLRPGDSVRVGQPRDGWSAVMADGKASGYVSRGTGALQSSEPVEASEASAPPVAFMSPRASGGNRYQRGPRGGCYMITASGNKRYVDRDLCD